MECACSYSFIYFNCLGCQFDIFGWSRAREAYEKALAIDPERADTLYNLANLLNVDDQERADQFCSKSSSPCRVQNVGYNYGSNLTNLHSQESAVLALKTSIFLDPTVADVGNLGLAYYGLDRFDEAERC